MATGWMKSLRCKSNALSDVNNHKRPSNPKIPTSYCASSYADVLLLLPKHHSARRKPSSPRNKPQPKSMSKPPNSQSELKSTSLSFPLGSAQPLLELPGPTFPLSSAQPLVELPAGHPSRRVVEIIFTSSWSPRSPLFKIEMLFRVCNPPRTVARFEDYRAVIRSRSSLGDARCAADGNEVMRFHCSSPSCSAVYGSGVATCAVEDKSEGGKVVEVVRTFAGSGRAHESAGGAAGRRAMLVCRVIAGRVRQESSAECGGDSVSLGSGELMVFDPRGVLPCFLIIYKV